MLAGVLVVSAPVGAVAVPALAGGVAAALAERSVFLRSRERPPAPTCTGNPTVSPLSLR